MAAPAAQSGGDQTPSAEHWLHCNKCLTVASKESSVFFLVSCGHILCKACCIKGATLASKQTCLLCQKNPVTYMDINRNINSRFKNLFRSTREVANECMAELQRVIDFQTKHRKNLQKGLSEQRAKAIQYAQGARGEMQKQKEKEKQMLKCLEKLKTENTTLKTQLEQLRNKNDFLGNPDSGVGTGDTSISMSFMEVMTSTPITEQKHPTRRLLADAFQNSNGSMPSPICAPQQSNLLTTPDMLGVHKRHHKNSARTPFAGEPSFGFN